MRTDQWKSGTVGAEWPTAGSKEITIPLKRVQVFGLVLKSSEEHVALRFYRELAQALLLAWSRLVAKAGTNSELFRINPKT